MFRAVTSLKRLVSKSLAGKWLLIPVGAAALSLPAITQAAESRFDRDRDGRDSRWSDRRDHDRRDHDRHDHARHDHHRHDYGRPRPGTHIDVDIRIGDRDRRPEYRERAVRVWVPPVYRTVVDRKWVEPVYRTECEEVWVPPVYEERVVQFIGGHGRLRTRIERVVVCEGHFEKQIGRAHV